MFAYYGPEWENLASRMVGRWCPSFSGATGLQLPDTSGFGNHGVLTNFANNGNDVYVANSDRLALDFDGTNDTVIVPDRPSISITGTGFTLSAWVRQTGATAYKQIFAKASDTGTTNRSYGLYITGKSGPGASNSLGFETRTSSTVENGFGVIASNVWTHCAGTYNGSVMTWYLQGAQVGQVSQAGNIASQNSALYLGQFSSGGFSTFSGQLDDIAIFNTALTPSEVRFIYEQGRGGGMLYQPPRRRSVAAIIAALVLACEAGNYSLTGQEAGLFASRLLAADQAQYILSGQASNALAGRLLPADRGQYNLLGQLANTLVGRTIKADPSAYVVTGNDAATICARLLDGGAAAYALTGTDAGLIANRKLTADQAVCFLAGNNAELLRALKLSADSRSLQLDGITASLLAGRKISADGAQYILVVSDANLTVSASGVGPYYYLFMMRGPQ